MADTCPLIAIRIALHVSAAIDPIAAQVVLDDSDLDVWQVPRNAYREALASFAEMQAWRVTL